MNYFLYVECLTYRKIGRLVNTQVIRNHMQKAVKNIKTLILLIISGVIIISGCTNVVDKGQHTDIEWVDFIKFNEITYLASHSKLGRDLIEDDLGESYSTVTFNVSNNVNETGYKSKNGDAAFLDEGTKIY